MRRSRPYIWITFPEFHWLLITEIPKRTEDTNRNSLENLLP